VIPEKYYRHIFLKDGIIVFSQIFQKKTYKLLPGDRVMASLIFFEASSKVSTFGNPTR
jgi:hypothetical protein